MNIRRRSSIAWIGRSDFGLPLLRAHVHVVGGSLRGRIRLSRERARPRGSILDVTSPAGIADRPLLAAALAVITAFLGAAAFFPALRLRRRARRAVLALLALPILLAPLWIPAGEPVTRAAAAIFACLMLFKAYDVHTGAEHGCRPDLRTYLWWLSNFLSLVLRKVHLEPRPTGRQNALRLAGAGAVIGVSYGGVLVLRQVDWQVHPFALEHTLKAVVLFAAFTAAFSFTIHLARLAGVQTRDFTSALWLARTPAEFWNRYNRNISQFLLEDVYKPARRVRSPLLAVVIAFAISAIGHEYIFSIAIGRIQGYQTVFFLLQGAVVAATASWKPTGWWAVPATAATVIFLLASSVLFFASFHGAATVYSDVPPMLFSAP